MPDNPRKRKRSLPSPSLPSPPSSERLRQVKPGISVSEGVRRASEEQQRPQYLSALERSGPSLERKRKQGIDGHVPNGPPEPRRKRNRTDAERERQEDFDRDTVDVEEKDPIHCWARTGDWPRGFGEMSEPESDRSNKRRRPSTPSYSSRAREGSAPRAQTAAYEEELQRYGIMFDDWVTAKLVSPESRDMCQNLLGAGDFAPVYNSSSEETYMQVFHRASKCNEERVRRDLTPQIVPSAELLYLLNGETALANVREEMSVDWTKCTLLGGTQPRPDYAYGLSSATFTDEELSKLENYTNVNNPTKFTESMYFPFLVCEAKCGKKNINDADRQNIHSASIAVNAIVQLCRAGGEDRARDLSGRILVFSISHDNERVKMYGHFPLFRDGRITFHRYYIHDYSLDGHYGRDRNTGSDFTRAVYRDFYPSHLGRIQQAIVRLSDPRTTSMVSDVSTGGDETQASEQSSQERSSSPRPPLHRTKSRGSQGELLLMKQQMARIEQMYKAQFEQQQKQMKEQKEESQKQMEQQKEESQKQMEQHNEESQKQIALLERLLDRDRSE